jgi:hypothetical protein
LQRRERLSLLAAAIVTARAAMPSLDELRSTRRAELQAIDRAASADEQLAAATQEEDERVRVAADASMRAQRIGARVGVDPDHETLDNVRRLVARCDAAIDQIRLQI